MAERRRRALCTVLILLSVAVLYALFCFYSGKGIPCVFNLITGLKCPGCGITRMFTALMRLDFKSAFNYNPAVLISFPVLAVILIRLLYNYIKEGSLLLGKKFEILTYSLIGYYLIFGILRNIFNF